MSNPSLQPSVGSEPLLLSFNDLGSRKVMADFSAGYLSSDEGCCSCVRLMRVVPKLGSELFNVCSRGKITVRNSLSQPPGQGLLEKLAQTFGIIRD